MWRVKLRESRQCLKYPWMKLSEWNVSNDCWLFHEKYHVFKSSVNPQMCRQLITWFSRDLSRVTDSVSLRNAGEARKFHQLNWIKSFPVKLAWSVDKEADVISQENHSCLQHREEDDGDDDDHVMEEDAFLLFYSILSLSLESRKRKTLVLLVWVCKCITFPCYVTRLTVTLHCRSSSSRGNLTAFRLSD
jgi:hypothetical protein